METDLQNREDELRRLSEQIRKLDDGARNDKDRFLNLEIEYKRIKMEYQILEKEKESEIRRLSRDREKDNSGLTESYIDSRIRSLQDEIKLKD